MVGLAGQAYLRLKSHQIRQFRILLLRRAVEKHNMANSLHDGAFAQCAYLFNKRRFFGLVAAYQLKLDQLVVIKRALELERDDGAWVYELELVTPQGRLYEVEIDAATGTVTFRDPADSRSDNGTETDGEDDSAAEASVDISFGFEVDK